MPSPAPLAVSPADLGWLQGDDILNRFIAYVAGLGLELYPAQEEALLELMAGKHVILNTPTGSGKSLVATALHFKGLAEGKTSFYTCPVKALVNEKFFSLCQTFGPDSVGMMTGDASINRDAPIICCTAEILANMALRGSSKAPDYVVMDEFHYYADRERGVAWQLPLLALRTTTFLLMSATLGDMRSIEDSLKTLTGREVATVRGAVRPVPLDFEYREAALHETIADLVAHGRAPIYLVNFTQRSCAEEAQNLMSVEVSSKEEKERIKEALRDARFDTPYGKELQRFVRHGVGLHHAGLLPKYRLLVEKLAQQGLMKVVSGTDTLGVGVNIPIRTVLFTQLCKYDGEKTAILRVREFHQIAGRAGRRGFDDRGSVVAQCPAYVAENIKLQAKKASGKKVTMQKPPTKGYVHWDRSTFDRLVGGTPEPLESRFSVSHGMLLNLLQAKNSARGGGYRRLMDLIAVSHESERARRGHRRHAAECFRSLRRAELIRLVPTAASAGRAVEVSEELQRDFSLHQTLSMYLLDTLPRLERESPTRALDVLTLVESIAENPDVILYRQLDRLKTQKVEEMKAAGVEYEDRIRQLEEMEWPKPNRDFIYQTFNEFADRHPWVGEENIRPKSVAREMIETFCSFEDFVREYDLQRSEGVVLRYLSDVYKTLVQTVPASFRDEQLEDIIAHLRAMIRGIDTSLLEEWEGMRKPAAPGLPAPKVEHSELLPRAEDLAANPRAFAAAVRADLHAMLRALAARNHEAALGCVFQTEGAVPWTAARLEQEMAPFWAAHRSLLVTPLARAPRNTLIQPDGDRRWRVQQRMIDSEGEEDWAIIGTVDLDREIPAGAPLVELERIGV